MRPASRRLLAFVLVAGIVLGFAVGWLARACSHPTLEEKARREAEELRERARGFFR